MDCKFIQHGIAVGYDQIINPCCAWHTSDRWNASNHIKDTDLSTWHQSSKVIEIKSQFESGVWPSPCTKCKQREDAGRQDSVRLCGTQAYSHYAENDITLEIRPGSVCNFACQTCWPAASSRVAQYHSQAGLINIEDVNSNALKDFSFLTPISHRIRDVILLGGEPFYDKSCKLFLDWAQKNLNANLIMFTNGSVIDLDWINNYPDKLTIVFSLDAVGRPAEYIRYGTVWQEVASNFNRLRTQTDVEVRVNITSSPYNYHLMDQLIDMLLVDWPDVVTFGVASGETFSEKVIPVAHRASTISKLEQTIKNIQQSNVEIGQMHNAVNAIQSIVNNLRTFEFDEELNKKWIDRTLRLDAVKHISAGDYDDELGLLLNKKIT